MNQAYLESYVDYLETELCSLHQLLVRCGFPEGIQSLKESAQELLLNQEMTEELS